MRVEDVQARCLQVMVGIAGCLAYAWLAATATFPVAFAIILPLPFLLVAVDALMPRPVLIRLRWRPVPGLASAGLIGVITVCVVAAAAGAIASPRPTTDQPVVLACAARDVLSGRIPYQTYEPQCFKETGYPPINATPLAEGPFRNDKTPPSTAAIRKVLLADERRGTHAGFPAFGYPPDAALIALPAAHSGWRALAIWTALACATLFAITWWRTPKDRLLLPATALLAIGLSLMAFGWNPEYVAYLLLALALARIDQVRLSAVAMALALCTNPLCWLAAPVYLVITYRQPRFRWRCGWLFASGVIGVGPWLIWDHALLAQIWSFLTMPEFPVGAALGQLASLPSPSHPIYFVLIVAGILAATAVAWRFPAWGWPMVTAVYLAFFLSWRGPLYYYFPIFWLAPAVIAGALRLGRSARIQPAVPAPSGPP